MIWKLHRFLLLHWRWYANLRLYVIADATDNSITFSRYLFRLLDVMDEADAKVFVCKLTGVRGMESSDEIYRPAYAFCINPPINQDTQLADIQYNAKYHCVGFESLCPTVNRIFYDYGIMDMHRVKLSVVPCSVRRDSVTDRIRYYVILPPKH